MSAKGQRRITLGLAERIKLASVQARLLGHSIAAIDRRIRLVRSAATVRGMRRSMSMWEHALRDQRRGVT